MSGFLNILKDKSEKRYHNFAIEEISSINRITEEAYLENPTWLGGDKEFVCLFIDLDNSSILSFKKHAVTMAKIYDYVTQNIVDTLNFAPCKANYIDIKGDGAFGIYEGEKAIFKALCAAVTFKTFFDKHIRIKFPINEQQGFLAKNHKTINCKMAIEQGKILVKKIGKRGDNNEVWAGRLINNASKLASLSKKIYQTDIELFTEQQSLLIVSENVYKKLSSKSQYTITSCGHDFCGQETKIRADLWKSYSISANEDVYGNIVYYMASRWCNKCGDTYMEEILK
ncbi:MAG: hypothetical protein A2240_00850 [Candidatus Jacksonbacteria bacterium RIFOXYA2_FULL_43_12]|nr:MAG: hypothetical protein A2240_00850 [Candidatus Jacksonbacteria bacterium RIFOXYA2_FULL_43_12]